MAAGVGRFDVIAPPVMCFPVCPAPLGIHQSGVLLQCAKPGTQPIYTVKHEIFAAVTFCGFSILNVSQEKNPLQNFDTF